MDKNTVGTVIEVLPNGLYKIQIESAEYVCYLAGKMKINHIHVLVGDKVEVVLDPYRGKTTNRIVKRLKE